MNGLVSVLMGVYNCDKTLKEAIQSIQKQTYTDWELIIYDDGSTDKSFDIALEMAKEDFRIKVFQNNKNVGLNITLNNCLKKASGDYIARMDADDVCEQERFQKQVAFLENHPEFSIVSTGMYLFDDSGRWGTIMPMEYPLPKDVVEGSPICHAPVMMYKKCLEQVGGYTEEKRRLRVEDVDLWIKLYAKGYRCYNLQEELYGMRNDSNAFARRKYRYRVNSVLVRLEGCKKLQLSARSYVKAIRPMIIGLVPQKLRQLLRKSMQYGLKIKNITKSND